MDVRFRGRLLATIAAVAVVAIALPLVVRPSDVALSGSMSSGVGSDELSALSTAAVPAGPSSGPIVTPTARPAAAPSAQIGAEPVTAPGARPTPSTPATAGAIAIVPISGFWSSVRSLTMDELRSALSGGDRRFRSVVVGQPDLAALAAALGISPGSQVRELAPEAAIAAVQGRTDVLGLIRATDIRPAVRALGVDARALFGNDRVRSIGEWPVTVPAPATTSAAGTSATFDPAATWTLVAGGDVMNDREVYRQTTRLGKGPDFPWSGGTAEIVRRGCCRAGQPFVTARRTGRPGVLAALFRGADLALVNHEGPTPDRSTYHPTGLSFTFDPRLEVGLAHAGVDVVSLANNHIRNAGSPGVNQTIRNVRHAGLVPVGAGRNATEARQPAWFTVDGVRVAILAYDAVDLGLAGATSRRAGAAPLDLRHSRRDIAAARAAGADVVIVVPHWGTEYTSRPTPVQRRLAAALIAAGADVILGSHPHWAGALESIGLGVVVYSMGDLVFDLPRSEQTDEGLVVELTFVGRRLAQIDIHPTIELDRSQPNLLDPAGDGRVVLDRVRNASRPFLHW